MRVVHVAVSAGKSYGGIGAVLRGIVEWQLVEGWQVTVVESSLRGCSSALREGRREARIVTVPTFRVGFDGMVVGTRLGAYLRNETKGADLVHVHGFRHTLCLAAARATKKCGCPMVVQPHGTLQREFGARELKRVFDVLVGKSVVSSACRILALTRREAARARLLGAAREQIRYVPNAVNVKSIQEHVSFCIPRAVRRQLDTGAERRVVLYFGRLHEIKGVDRAIRAVAAMADPAVVLWVVGPDDGVKNDLIRLSRSILEPDQIRFAPGVYGPEKYCVLAAADVVVLPSRYDVFPMVVLEALACGTPVVISADCELAATVRTVVGCEVSLGRTEALAAALQTMLESKSRHAERACVDQAAVERLFATRVMRGRLKSVYSELVQR